MMPTNTTNMKTFAAADGLKLAYYVDDFTDPWRTPDTLLLLHAAMGSALRWFNWVPRLARRYRVVRLDLRGHGNSAVPAPEQPFSLAHLVGDALQLLDLVGARARTSSATRRAAMWPSSSRSTTRDASRRWRSSARRPGLKHSHAPTWIPKIGEVGLKRFLADTIAERFDQSADPEHVEVVHRAGGLQRSGLHRAASCCTCARTTSWRTSTRYARRR